MAMALLDILDSNLQLWYRERHLQSPGYALLAGQHYQFGASARAAARLQPRNINTRYWWQLSTDKLQPPMGPARHAGDLVHAHLQHLHKEAGKPAELLLAVPGSMQREQLSLLLGIAEHCPFEVVGLVNRSVALAGRTDNPQYRFHLEIQLHQAVLSQLAYDAGQVALQQAIPLPGCGLLHLQERLVEIIASAFVRQTRFDPRRQAASEQQLYDALPVALQQLSRDNEANIQVDAYRARISRGELQGAGQRLFDAVAHSVGPEAPGPHLLVDPIAGLLPGLTEQLGGALLLDEHSLPEAVRSQAAKLTRTRGEPLTLITRLPCPGNERATRPEIEDNTSAHEPATTMPTHLLRDAIALPLQSAGTVVAHDLGIYRSESGWRLQGNIGQVHVNGETPATDQILLAGDTISTEAGSPVQLIVVCP